jgi:hypothetical protein
MLSVLTTRQWSISPGRAIAPPLPPAKPMVVSSISRAFAKARSKLGELPLVEKPMSPSPAASVSDYLTDEHVLDADIVADRRQHGRVSDEIDGGQCRSTRGDRMQKLDREVRRVARGAAITHREHAPVAAVHRRNCPRAIYDLGGVVGEKAPFDIEAVRHLLAQRLEQRRVQVRRLLPLALKERVKLAQRCAKIFHTSASDASMASSS